MFKQIALAGNCILTLGFCLCFDGFWAILASPVLHILAYVVNPQCSSKHCEGMSRYEKCQECGLPQWIRMHHCYRCGVCVHKYDHHCVLLGFCVGEANQKYYFLMLWAHLVSSLTQTCLYFQHAGSHLWVDQLGNEHMKGAYVVMSLLIIFFLFNTLVVGYLAVYHTQLLLVNETTYEMKRREKIKYIPAGLEDHEHPFDRGIWSNFKEVFLASSRHPKEWAVPDRKKSNVEADDHLEG